MMKERWGRIVNISSVVGESGKCGAGELRGVKSRTHRADEIARAGDGQPQYHRERGRTGIHRDGHDRELSPELKENMVGHIA